MSHLLMRGKLAEYDPTLLERELGEACGRLDDTSNTSKVEVSPYVRSWYASQAASDLLRWRALIPDHSYGDVLRGVLARAARSARRTTHFELDFPRRAQLEPHWCHKHRGTCRPMEAAVPFLRRYALGALARIRRFSCALPRLYGTGPAPGRPCGCAAGALPRNTHLASVSRLVAALGAAAARLGAGAPVVAVCTIDVASTPRSWSARTCAWSGVNAGT